MKKKKSKGRHKRSPKKQAARTYSRKLSKAIVRLQAHFADHSTR